MIYKQNHCFMKKLASKKIDRFTTAQLTAQQTANIKGGTSSIVIVDTLDI